MRDYCAPHRYIVSLHNCKMYLIVVITKTSVYFFPLSRRLLLREIVASHDKWSISARCSFVVRDRVCGIHEKAVPSRNCRRDWPESADRSHDLSFFALSDPPPSEAFASPFLYFVAFTSRLIPDNEITNYGLINRSRRIRLTLRAIQSLSRACIDHRFCFYQPPIT